MVFASNSVKSIVSFLSRVLSIFCCSSCVEPKECDFSENLNLINQENENNHNDDKVKEVKDSELTREIIVNSFVSQFTSSINTNDFFCGSIPSSIMDLCCLYYKFCNTFILNINDYYLNLSSNPKCEINEDNDNKYIEYCSKPFNINNGFVFRNIINIEYNKEISKYETCYYLQLMSLPKDIENITIDYELSSKQIDVEWKDIVTLSVGDIVGSPSALNTKQSLVNIYKNNTKCVPFSCDVKILLKNGKSIC